MPVAEDRAAGAHTDEFVASVRRYLAERADLGTVRDVVDRGERYRATVWQDLAGMGLPGLAVDAARGGDGAGWTVQVRVLEQLGAVLYPGPYLPTVGLALPFLVAAAAGDDARAAELVRRVVAGQVRLALLAPVDLTVRTGAGAAAQLSGTGLAVAAQHADVLVVDAGDDRVFLVEPGAAGVTVHSGQALDLTRPVGRVCLHDAPAHPLAVADVAAARDAARVAVAAESVGVAQRCLDRTVDYAKQRVQFGRPIGSFQAIKHQCADLLVAVEGARSAVYAAAAALDGDGDEVARAGAAAMAKACAGDVAVDAAAAMIQVHGALGFTWEADAHLFYRRALANRALLGDGVTERGRLAALLLDRPRTPPSGAPRRTDDPHDALRRRIRGVLADRLPLRRPGAEPAFLGISEGTSGTEAGRRYLETFADLGWSTPLWPRDAGGAGFSFAEAVVLAEELADYEVPDLYPYAVGLRMVAAVLFAHGTPEQRSRWLEPIRLGRQVWCQLFSEAEAGSDLAGIRCRARRVPDGWVIDGRKLWTSRASYADLGLLIARSDPDSSRRDGLTAFAVDMTAPGIEVRPLRQMNGDAHFAEVTFTGAPVGDDCRLGAAGDGWQVAMTTLSNERIAVETGIFGFTAAEVLGWLGAATLDPVRRDELMQAYSAVWVAQQTAARVNAALLRGAPPGPAASGVKLRNAAAVRRLVDVAMGIRGADALLDDSFWSALVLSVPSLGIRGGAEQIQKNIIAERVLGLPKEPR